MKLRDYQVDAVESVIERLRPPGASTLGVAATGMGKTVMLVTVADQFAARGRVLIIAHRAELIHQAAAKVSEMTNHRVEIEMAADRANVSRFWRGQIVVASKDSLRGRLDNYDPKEYDLIITDEAHHAPAKTYRKIIKHFKAINPSVRHLGVTATPDRLDGTGLINVYESVAFNYDIRYGIENGWLVDIRQRPVHVESIDFVHIKRTAGDFNAKQLDAELRREANAWKMAQAVYELAGDRKTLVFAASVAHAELLADIIGTRGGGRAEMISGKTPEDERRAILRSFRAGEIQYLCNVDVFTEGFDEPSIEVVAMCRPTQSRAKYTQMVGRGTRTLPGVVDGLDDRDERLAAIAASSKPIVDVIDFVGNAGKHKLITTVDILGEHEDEDTLDRAKQIIEKSPDTATRDAIEEAKDQLEAEAEERRRQARDRVKRVEARVDYHEGAAVSAFDVLGLSPMAKRDAYPTPSTNAQVETLKKFGVPNPEQMSKREATRLIGQLIQRRQEGKPTFKQTQLLSKFGVDATGMSYEQASARIDQIAKAGWRKTST